MIKTSVVIPIHEGGPRLIKCVKGLSEQTKQPFEMIAVLDGILLPQSDIELLQKNNFKIVINSRPSGPASTRNRGALRASGDLLLFVDSDVWVPPHLLRDVENYALSHPDVAAFFGSYDTSPSEPNFWSQYRNLFHHYVHQQGRLESSTFWTGCGAIRREIFLDLGGFDEELTAIEDIELGYRLKEHGYSVHLVKSLQVTHLKHWTFKSTIKTDLFVRAIPWTCLILGRSDRLIPDLNLKRLHRVSTAFVWLVSFLIPFITFSINVSLIILCILGALILSHFDLFRFFIMHKGFWFTLRTIPCHWLYFWICGLGFLMGLFKFSRSQRAIRLLTQ